MNAWLRRDALNRSWRTILQGVLAVVVLPALDAAVQVVQRDVLGMFAGQPFDWKRSAIAAGVSAATAAMMAVSAYVHRLKIDPARLPSAEPPRPPGVSASEAPATEPVTVVGTVRKKEPGGVERAVVYAEVPQRNWWRPAFYGLTALVIVMELWAAADARDDKPTWTDLLIRLPWVVLMPLAVGFAVWLPWHFWDAKRRRG